jgi:hypothetical protein
VLRDVLLRRPARVDDLVHGRLSDREPVDQLHAQRLAAIQTLIAALAPTSTLIVFSSSRIGCVCVHLPLDERDEEPSARERG